MEIKHVVMAAAMAIALGGTSAVDAAWPEKPIKLVVPFMAGGTSDQVARAFQLAIQEHDLLPQPITVINVGGHLTPRRPPPQPLPEWAPPAPPSDSPTQ
jgi:tripartite-type tricarboxylate transporter receptor subunit TctC